MTTQLTRNWANLEPLPKGPHKLPPEAVLANQIGRIVEAIATITSEKGYVAMSVEDIVVESGVSRRTFYDNFKNKQDAYLAGFRIINADMLAIVSAATTEGDGEADGALFAIKRLLDLIAEHPRYSHMCIVEVLAAGPEALELRNKTLRSIARAIDRSMRSTSGSFQCPLITAEMVVGGIYELVYARLIDRQADQLPAMLHEIAYAAALPYLGHEAAAAAVAKL